jgi:hypothetical protein
MKQRYPDGWAGYVTNHSINGTAATTNHSINSTFQSMQQVNIGHGQNSVFLFKTFGKIRRTGKT